MFNGHGKYFNLRTFPNPSRKFACQPKSRGISSVKTWCGGVNFTHFAPCFSPRAASVQMTLRIYRTAP
ncbi:MAG: hypothetical protein ACRC2T_05985 [Thermoguttaceae bacterium]